MAIEKNRLRHLAAYVMRIPWSVQTAQSGTQSKSETSAQRR